MKPRLVKLIYVGRRAHMWEPTKLKQCFMHGKKELFWSGIRHPHIGKVYASHVDDKGAHTMAYRPECFGYSKLSTDEKLNEQRDPQKKKLLEAVEPLRPLLSKMSHWELRGFAEFLVARFGDKQKKARRK